MKIRHLLILALSIYLCISVALFGQEEVSQIDEIDISLGVLVAEKGAGVATNFQAQASNGEGDALSARTGLFLFSGDLLESRGERVDILVPEVLTVITLDTFTKVRFNTIPVSPVETIGQFIVEAGQVTVETLDINTVYQRLNEIFFNEQERPDKKVSENNNVEEIFFHIAYDDAIVELRNVEQKNNVFVTHADIDIIQYIKSYQEYRFSSDLDLQRIFMPKTYPYQPTIQAGLEMRSSIHNLQNYVLDVDLQFGIQYKKFSAFLSGFGIYWRNPTLYNPYGNPLSFGTNANESQQSGTDTPPILHQTYQILSDLFIFIDYLEYGYSKYDDTVYFYFGRPRYWDNTRIPSLVHKYKPSPSAQNNINLDIELDLNLGFFGNQLYMRTFAPDRISDPWLEEWDIILNRLWFKPVETVPTLEFGVSLGVDFNLDKFSQNDTNEFVLAFDGQGSFSNLLYGLDITIPIAYRPRWTSEIVLDGAGLLILQENAAGLRLASVQYRGYTNFNGGFSYRNMFSNIGQDYRTGFNLNLYLSRGISNAHYFSFGHEYNSKYILNRNIANFIGNPTDPIFNIFLFTGEFEFVFELPQSLRLDLGASLPHTIFNDFISTILQNTLGAEFIAADGYDALDTDDPYVYFDFSWRLASFNNISNIRIGSFIGLYLDDLINQNFDLTSGSDFISQSIFNGENLIDFYAEATLVDFVTLKLGYSSEPEYNSTGGLVTNDSGSLPRIVHYPYITIGINYKFLK